MLRSESAHGCESARVNGVKPRAAPTTPRGHASKEVNGIIESIAREFQLPIRPRQTATSPRKREDTLDERCVDSIVYLFFRNRPELSKVIDTFRDDYRSGHTQPDLLTDFAGRIRDAFWIEKEKPVVEKPAFNKPSIPSVPQLKKPSPSKQTQLIPQIRKSSRLSQSENQKLETSSPHPAQDGYTLPSPERSLKRQSDQDIPSPAKYVSSKKKKRQRQSHISDHFTLYKGSTTDTSFSSKISAPSIFSAANTTSFASTVPTEVESEDEFQSSGYGELDLSQADKLMMSFDRPDPIHDSFLDQPKSLLNSIDNIHLESDTNTKTIQLQEDIAAVSGARKGLEHHLVRSLPTDGLFVQPIPTELLSMPFPFRWEHHRVASTLERSLPYSSNPTELYDHFKDSTNKAFQRSPASVWEAVKDPAQAPNIIYKANLAFSSGKSPDGLFELTLQPLRYERASRLQRAFGSHRFLYLEMPQLSRLTLPSHLKDQVFFLKDRFLEWMCTDKELLGCKWRVFHIQDIKRKHRAVATPGQRLVLFAVEGPGLKTISIENLLDWAIPLSDNAHQGFCKAYARLDLFLSQTISTVIFKPSEVKLVKDTKADGTTECRLFDDPNLKFDSGYNPFNRAVMNDGCSLLSVGAAKEVCQLMGITGVKPVAFQGRINGCKGVWTISAPYDTTDPKHQARWITIAESQQKVSPRKEDLDDALCEADRWSFEVVKFASPPRASTLNLEFIPILKDRHVSRSTLREVIESQIQLDFSAFLDSLEDPVSLRRWIHSQFATMEEVNRMTGLRQLGSLPAEWVERSIMLIESGFSPTECPYLADCVKYVSEFWLTQMKQKLKIHLGKSTMALGIADHTGCLKPGEIYMAFSETFRDETSGEVWSYLKGEVLVARHPSLRNSDVQKVRAVYKEELSHLTDIVVFPSKGCIPLAHKLQGGDYDGDTFWLCWDRRLTSTFLNAPAPLNMRPLEFFGIQKDSRKLGEILGKDQSNIDEWLSESFKFKLQEDRLGQVTNFHKKLSYKENNISSPNIDSVADLHDLIIDSAKNGYTFTYSAWSNFAREKLGIKQSLHKPAYEKWSEPKTASSSEDDDIVQPNYQHIIDYLLFKVVNPCILKMQRTRKKKLECSGNVDTDLEKIFRDRQASSDDNPIIKGVLRQLVIDVEKIKLLTNPSMGREYFDVQARKTYEAYIAIQPIHMENSLIQEWLRRDVGYAFTTWELIRASAFYAQRHKKSTLVFLCAGRELCFIKAMGNGNTRSVVDGIYATYKPRKEKKVLGGKVQTVVEEEESEDDEFFDFTE